MAVIAFIGLGNMGLPMCKNLLKAGHTVVGFDLQESYRDRVAAAGAKVAGSIAEAVGQAEVVMTMVPAGQHVRTAYQGEGGILESARPGTFLIDSSTIDVESSRAVHQAASAAGFDMVDAPVSGAVPAAEAGTLVFMVGGTKESFDEAVPILKAMGTSQVYVGEAGCGEAMKICNNMMAGMSMVALSEKIGRAHVALQSLMRISYAVFCLKKKMPIYYIIIIDTK